MYWKKSDYWRKSGQNSFLSPKQICDKGRQVTEKSISVECAMLLVSLCLNFWSVVLAWEIVFACSILYKPRFFIFV